VEGLNMQGILIELREQHISSSPPSFRSIFLSRYLSNLSFSFLQLSTSINESLCETYPVKLSQDRFGSKVCESVVGNQGPDAIHSDGDGVSMIALG
jgi:hypothetical protein